MNNVAVKTKNLYNDVLRTYKRAQHMWLELETAKTSQAPKIVIDKLLETLDTLVKMINKFNINSLQEYYPPETIDKIRANMGAHRDQIRQLERKVLAMKHFDNISPKIGGYVNEIGLDDREIRKFGTMYNLIKQFLSSILHPNNIRDMESQLTALGKGTMTTPAFSRWFRHTMFPTGMPSKEKLTSVGSAAKYGHPESWRRAQQEFQSLKDYKRDEKKRNAEKTARVKFRKK